MEFLRHLLIAIVIFIAGSIIAFTGMTTQGATHGYFFLFGALGAQIWLAVAALRLRAKNLPGFDMVVASELIIALGIMALISGIFTSIMFALQSNNRVHEFSFEKLRPLLTPFAEGLLAAGFAPLLATVLRQIEVLKYGPTKGEETTPEAAIEAELESLKSKIRDVTSTLENFISAYKRSQTMFEKSATSFNKSADRYEAAAGKLEGAIGRLEHIATTKGEELGAGLGAVNRELSAYGKELAQSSRQMSSLTDETRRFQAAANEGATLLSGLRSVIESVERFIRPDR